MECNIVTIWTSFDWNVSKMKREDRTTKRCDLFSLFKNSYMRANSYFMFC